jgi:hypothetical protein
VKPVFVFPGLSIARKDRPFGNADGRAQKRLNAWDAYFDGQSELAASLFQASGKATIYLCHIIVMRRTHYRHRESHRSQLPAGRVPVFPYERRRIHSRAIPIVGTGHSLDRPLALLMLMQLALLAPGKQGLVSDVYGGLELLLFGVTRLIISIDADVQFAALPFIPD